MPQHRRVLGRGGRYRDGDDHDHGRHVHEGVQVRLYQLQALSAAGRPVPCCVRAGGGGVGWDGMGWDGMGCKAKRIIAVCMQLLPFCFLVVSSF